MQEIVIGPGLTGGGNPNPTTGSISLGIDWSVVQSRVTGACPAGESIAAIAEDGSVTCSPDADTTYSAGLGLLLSGFVFSVDTDTIQARIAGACGAGEAIRLVNADGTVSCASLAGDFIQNGTSPQDASFNVTGSGEIGFGLGPFANKLRIAGGSWNPNDSDTDVLIGDAVHRLKVGVATGGGGAGDVRLRAQGGTNRMMIGGGMSDTLTVTPDRVGIGTITPLRPLDARGSAYLGLGAGDFENKLSIKGGNWNPNDSDTDVLIGDALYRLKIGVATGGGGAGDARLRAQGGTNRMMIGGGSADTLTVTPSRVGIGTIEPQSTLDVRGDARVSGTIRAAYAPGAYRPAAPLAYGTINSAGGVVPAGTTDNVTASYDPALQAYVITIAGVFYNSGTHTTPVTAVTGAPVVATSFSTGTGNLVVRLFQLDGTIEQAPFSFVVFGG